MTTAEVTLLDALRALPAPDRAGVRDKLRRMVDDLPALDRRHTSGELEHARQESYARAKAALYEAIRAIPDTVREA